MNKFLQNPKMKIIVISASAVLLLTIIVVVIACCNIGKEGQQIDDTESDDAVGAFHSASDFDEPDLTAKPSDPAGPDGTVQDCNGLVFVSNGDGTCIVAGIGTCTATELSIPEKSPEGDTVTEISASAFDGCTAITTVNIPANVKKIGTGAFSGCKALTVFTVDTANTSYCAVGGVMFSKDKTELICYPASRVGKSYLLSTNVKIISDYAFDGVVNLRTLLYEGSMAKFQSITVGSGNDAFNTMSVTCNYKAAK